jgi:hypothetical protein
MKPPVKAYHTSRDHGEAKETKRPINFYVSRAQYGKRNERLLDLP